MGFLRGMIAERLAALGPEAREINLAICEVFADPPASLSPGGGPSAWHCIVGNGAMEFGTCVIGRKSI